MKLRVDPIACDAHGMCAEVFPEFIELDDWGYPIIPDEEVPQRLVEDARRAVAICPKLALRLDRAAQRDDVRG
jgi:ferredoxin